MIRTSLMIKMVRFCFGLLLSYPSSLVQKLHINLLHLVTRLWQVATKVVQVCQRKANSNGKSSLCFCAPDLRGDHRSVIETAQQQCSSKIPQQYIVRYYYTCSFSTVARRRSPISQLLIDWQEFNQ